MALGAQKSAPGILNALFAPAFRSQKVRLCFHGTRRNILEVTINAVRPRRGGPLSAVAVEDTQ